jgi:hypothetical protein
MQSCLHAFGVCANGASLFPMKNDPGAHASGSSNLALNVTPFDTLRMTLTEWLYSVIKPRRAQTEGRRFRQRCLCATPKLRHKIYFLLAGVGQIAIEPSSDWFDA